MCDAGVEEGAGWLTPDRGRVDGVGLDVAGLASLDDSVGRSVVGEPVVVRDEVVVIVLGNLARRRVASGAEVGPDTSAGGVDVERCLAGHLVTPLRASEKRCCAGDVEDVSLRARSAVERLFRWGEQHTI